MPHIGVYHVPFPYDPYPLQEDAVNKLSRFLREDVPQLARQRQARGSGDTAAGKRAREDNAEDAVPPLAILESPTGTGKSQMLLNAVLAAAFAIVPASESPQGALADKAEVASEEPEGGDATVLTLDEVVAKQRLADECDRLKRERQQRLRAERRKLRLARQYMKQHLASETRNATAAGMPTEVDPAEFLIDQDPIQFLREHAPGVYQSLLSTHSPTAAHAPHRDGDFAFSSAHSSDAEDGGNHDGGRHGANANGAVDVDDDLEDEEQVSQSLATLVPLRARKVYFASRTHTQLAQLRGDLEKTAFAGAWVRVRDLGEGASASHPPTPSTSPPHRLRAVHVASRQQLCVNARIRAAAARRAATDGGSGGGGGDALNELCLGAMRYEYSAAGRAARRQHRREEAQRGGAVFTTSSAGIVDLEELSSLPGADGAESLGSGCVFCGEAHLRALIHYIQQQQQQQQCTSSLSDAHAPVSFTNLSLETMTKLGRELQACPYLATRLLVRGADVLFIPYGYLADEVPRESLLRGVATNPATETEEQAQGGLRDATNLGEEEAAGLFSGSTALGAVLYRRRARRGHGLGSSARTGGPAGRHENSKHVNGVVEEAALAAVNAPPNFAGSLLVFDEAHNLADHCRSISTAVVTAMEVSLTRALVQIYLTRYEKRLLSKSKQRLREMDLFLGKVLRGASSSMFKARQDSEGGAMRVVPFTSFIFAAEVDHVDVFAFLAFLADSRLFPKLHGMVLYGLDHERQEAAAAVAAPTKRAIAAQKATTSGDDASQHTRLMPLFAQLLAASACVAPLPSARAAPLTNEVCVSLARRALHRMENFLRWFYLSSDSSRLLLHESVTGAAESLELTLVQLHPATHTLLPVLRAARATVLAGGTMQPLALTCAPLLAMSPAILAATTTTTGTTTTTTSPPAAAHKPICLIREGHVVPSSSVAVWALGSGPSGRKLIFRHTPVDAVGADSTTTSIGGSDFAELALTLLNVARVMPPAGLVCFFTSFDVESRFVDFLQQDSAHRWNALNAVKKVFREASCRRGGEAMKGRATLAAPAEAVSTMDDLLLAYREWIETPSSSGARRGAILFAVMGGRLSEGINFADDLGRCVVVVGMPFASPSDPELRLHLRHLSGDVDQAVAVGDGTRRGGVTPSRAEGLPLPPHEVASEADVDLEIPFSPAEWRLYTDMCMRTVNQSIGRCIRHVNDYATIVLLDDRYVERRDVRQRVSGWLQPSLTVATGGFPQCIRGLKQFFDTHKAPS